jgi:hypothetical protein
MDDFPFPREITRFILSYLDWSSLLKVKKTSKKNRALIDDIGIDVVKDYISIKHTWNFKINCMDIKKATFADLMWFLELHRVEKLRINIVMNFKECNFTYGYLKHIEIGFVGVDSIRGFSFLPEITIMNFLEQFANLDIVELTADNMTYDLSMFRTWGKHLKIRHLDISRPFCFVHKDGDASLVTEHLTHLAMQTRIDLVDVLIKGSEGSNLKTLCINTKCPEVWDMDIPPSITVSRESSLTSFEVSILDNGCSLDLRILKKMKFVSILLSSNTRLELDEDQDVISIEDVGLISILSKSKKVHISHLKLDLKNESVVAFGPDIYIGNYTISFSRAFMHCVSPHDYTHGSFAHDNEIFLRSESVNLVVPVSFTERSVGRCHPGNERRCDGICAWHRFKKFIADSMLYIKDKDLHNVSLLYGSLEFKDFTNIPTNKKNTKRFKK